MGAGHRWFVTRAQLRLMIGLKPRHPDGYEHLFPGDVAISPRRLGTNEHEAALAGGTWVGKGFR